MFSPARHLYLVRGFPIAMFDYQRVDPIKYNPIHWIHVKSNRRWGDHEEGTTSHELLCVYISQYINIYIYIIYTVYTCNMPRFQRLPNSIYPSLPTTQSAPSLHPPVIHRLDLRPYPRQVDLRTLHPGLRGEGRGGTVADDVPRAAHSTARHGVDGPKVVDGGFDPKVAFFWVFLGRKDWYMGNWTQRSKANPLVRMTRVWSLRRPSTVKADPKSSRSISGTGMMLSRKCFRG